MTPPSETQAQSETLNDGAAVVNRWRGMNVKISRDLYQSPAAVAQLCEMINSALRNERERCAMVALEQRCERGTPWDAACVAIAKAIREGGVRRQ